MREAMFFNNSIPEPNTFIGGVGATSVTSAADYASKTNLLESDIKNFQIDISNNVSFFVNKSYNHNNFAFSSDVNLTWFIDTQGYLGRIRIEICDNLQYVYAPNAFANSTTENFGRNSSLIKLNYNPSSLSARFLLQDISTRILYLPNVTSALNTITNRAACINMSEIERLYLPNMNNVSQAFTNGSRIAFSNFFIDSIKSNCKVYYNSVFGIQNRNAYAKLQGFYNVGDIININGLQYTGISGTPTLDGEFNADTSGQTGVINLVSAINNDTRIGTFSNITAVHLGNSVALVVDDIGALGNAVTVSMDPGNTSLAIVVHSFKGGNDLHPWLIYARDERSATLIEVTTSIIVNPPTNLSISNQTVTSVDLNFTAPIANVNGNDGYEVWVDDGTIFRKWFEFTEISSSGDTLDLTDVFNDVGTISGTKIKIRTIDGHFNLSDFSNEITLI